MKTSKLVVLLTFFLAIFWSMWFWNNYPIKPVVDLVTQKPEKVTEYKNPPRPFDVVYMGDTLAEVRANCKSELGEFHSALFNWEDMAFFPVCYVNGTYYKVHVPERELPKHPCLPDIDPDPKCDNY